MTNHKDLIERARAAAIEAFTQALDLSCDDLRAIDRAQKAREAGL